MKFWGLVIIGLALSRSASAQAVKSADLVGQWAKQGAKEPALEFRADSTFTVFKTGTLRGTTPVDVQGRWGMAGDTLTYSQVKGVLPGGKPAPGDAKPAFGGDLIRLVKISGQTLTLTRRDGKKQFVFERLEAPKP